MYIIKYSPTFLRSYKKLPDHIKKLVEEKESIIRQNPFDVNLRTHKLQGKWRQFWALSINFKYRLIFTFEGDKILLLIDTGTHDIYRSIL